ncbi:MAG TPA: hypothetical protein VKX46_05795 [Ktedonobacteraceae bacterium]|jgi:hypothetical protein|nr:hypothetical protein [Ktedonobacteraceae bacterium]
MPVANSYDLPAIRDLVARLELERSSLACVQLAHACGYELVFWYEAQRRGHCARKRRLWVEVTRHGQSAWYDSFEALCHAMLCAARRLIRHGS